ncbi:hypothetical protein PZA11_006195 [Diplocarpon coronariae]
MEEGSPNGRNDAHFLQGVAQNGNSNDGISRATSPGHGCPSNGADSEEKRYRPRTFPYFALLPYAVEEEIERDTALSEILRQLYIALKAEDISPGAVHWTRELRGWLNLKFDITRELRIKLVKMYYMLSMAPGIDWVAADRFESMFRFLIKKKHYLKPGEDLTLDWRPLWKEIKSLVLPNETATHQGTRKRNHKNLSNMCIFATQYFDPRARQDMLEEILPYFSASEISGAFIVLASSPYSGLVDLGAGLGMYLERDRKKVPVSYSIARWIVMSLSPACVGRPGSILSNLEGLMESVDTFFHPSNQGAWTDTLAQVVFHLVDFFVMRCNREQSGELVTPPGRRITEEVRKRFVLSLKEVVFMGIFSKKAKSLNFFFGAFQGLAYLEPHLIMPGALQRFYPSLQGLVEVHRTTSSLAGLQLTAHVMSKQKGLRCHITALLALALPGIDANDLQKTMHTLNFIQAVAYSIPFVDLTREEDGIHDSSLAIQWVQGEMERMEREGPNIEIDYPAELSDEDEAKIVRSSTAGFGEFVLSLLGKIFTLLENIPELSRARMLSMIIVHVGDSLMPYKKELFDIALYMQEKCRGVPTVHISNYIHHLLLNLTLIYTVDGSLYEPRTLERGLDVSDWGQITAPSELTIHWHLPSEEEVSFAVELFESQVQTAMERLTNLTSENPAVSRLGKNKEWSDEVSRNLSQLRLIVAGIATLFDPKKASGQLDGGPDGDPQTAAGEVLEDEDESPLAEGSEDAETRPQFHYRAGYLLKKNTPTYDHIHRLREDIGHLLSRIHHFLSRFQEDDVACFTALYQTYRTWITDVGNERSAHMLERVTKLYNADIRPFKVNGLRKPYPRSLLVKRANIYHLQRSKHNASARHKSDLDKKLLLELAASATSLYAEVRINAQAALESALKSLIGGRPLVIPVLLKTFGTALERNDYDRIKGSMYTLLFSSLTKTIAKDWRFAPELIELYIKSVSVDKPSIQKINTHALYSGLLEYGKSLEQIIIVEDGLVDVLEPKEDPVPKITSRHSFIMDRRRKVEKKKQALALKLVEASKNTHWKIAAKSTLFILNSGLRIQTLAAPPLIELAVNGAVDDHPGLRASYTEIFTRIFDTLETRAIYGHTIEKYVREEENSINRVDIPVQKTNPNWTQEFLDAFESTRRPDYFVERDFPGWLAWGESFRAARSLPLDFTDYDELETSVRKQIGSLLTIDWYKRYFAHMKQEPRDASSDRFRVHNAAILIATFDLTLSGLTVATLDEIKEEIKDVFGDGSDKHQHRATAEIVAALLICVIERPIELRDGIWDYGVPIMLQVFKDGLTPENISYWMTCLHMIIGGRDPRQAREIIDTLTTFRLDMSSNAAFKESSQIQLLEFVIQDAGWHFRAEKPILEDFLAHIDHPYKAVREAIGRTISSIYRTRYYEAFPDVKTLLHENKASSSIGIKPYTPSAQFAASLKDVFTRLEIWRGQRTPGQQTPSSYTSGSKTVLLWLDTTLQSHECTQLLDFFPDVFMEQLLHMMDVKEDPELQRLAYQVYRHLPNIPFRAGEDGEFISALIRIGKVSTSWHQRLRALINMQVIYFRRIFLIRPQQQQALFEAVAEMLEDTQTEVRSGAATTLSGMICCSPVALRNNILSSLQGRFTEALRRNPMPKRVPGTSTPINNNLQVIRRHAAVLGLGALVTAFPYTTPPPEWMPEVLALLASKASNDAGAIGMTVKSILADFKKTRQDTWVTDQKVRSPLDR